jgi:hypothetical protein
VSPQICSRIPRLVSITQVLGKFHAADHTIGLVCRPTSSLLFQTSKYYSELLGFRTLSIVRYSKNYKTQHFTGLRLALSKGPNGVGLSVHLRTETDIVSEKLRSRVFRIPDDEESPKPSNSECYTPSSEPFRI